MRKVQTAFELTPNDVRVHMASTYPTIAFDPHFMYQGGPLMSSVAVFPIFFGGFAYESFAMDLYIQLVDSKYMSWLGESYNSGGQTIGKGSVIGSATIASDPGLTPYIKDKALQAWIINYVEQNLPRSQITTNLYVPFHYSRKYSVSSGGTTSFCGYHDSINVTNIPGVDFITYAVMPDVSNTKGCGLIGDDAMSQTISHELAEAVTDPYRYVSGWYDDYTSGDITEIADICQGSGTSFTFPNGKTYMLENLWDPVTQRCQIYPGSPNSLPVGTIVKGSTDVILPSVTSSFSIPVRTTSSTSTRIGSVATSTTRSSALKSVLPSQAIFFVVAVATIFL